MEKELFTWDEFDCGDEYIMFLNIKLIKPIGSFPVGTEFTYATIFEDGILVLSQDGEDGISEYKFKLSYQVGEEIK